AQARGRASDERRRRPRLVRNRAGACAGRKLPPPRPLALERRRARAKDRARPRRDLPDARRARAGRARRHARRHVPSRFVNPYWLEEPSSPRSETKLEGRADVAIVGAGVTGCAAALRLADAGLRVRVYDQRAVAEGASGRNGGFALPGAGARYDVARETYGHQAALALWRWTERALDRMAELAGDALRRPGSFRLAADEEEHDQIRGEYEALREDGIAAEWLDDLPGPLAGRFHGAILHAGDGALQPARWVRRLAARAAEAGAEIREHDRVDDVEALDAEQVVVATDGYGHGLVPELAAAIWPTRGPVIVGEPLGRGLSDRPHYP